MSYSKTGAKPFEYASKASHHHIINDPSVVAALSQLYVPDKTTESDLKSILVPFEPETTAIEHVIAIDGGYTEAPLRDGYPSAILTFFQFGALHFRIADLKSLEHSQHISPEAMRKLKQISRIKFPLATQSARRKDCSSILDSVRKSIFEFFAQQKTGQSTSLLDTLAWFVFRRYKHHARTTEDRKWLVSSSPYRKSDDVNGQVLFEESSMQNYSFICPSTGKVLYLTDVFRLHERIEEEAGASGIAAYVAGVVEHAILLHMIRFLLETDPSYLSRVLFIMDRPTGFFGVTASLRTLMLELNNWLFDNYSFYLAGLEKSGAFVEHAAAVRDQLPAGSLLLLDDSYIYNHISPGEENPSRPYAVTSNYGQKVIFRTREGQMYVVSLPVRSVKKAPSVADIPNLHAVLTHVEQLRCDMYENALLPIALANKLVSLSAHPSSQILKAFARSTVAA